MESTSGVAVWSSRIAVAGVVLFVLGPVLSQLGAPPELGFRIFGLGGVLLAFIAVVLGAVGLWLTRPAAGHGGRGQARRGALLGIALLGSTLVLGSLSSVSKGGAAALPAINDITTDLADPPEFAKIADLPANADRDMAYPGEEFALQQQQAYPDLETLHLEGPPGQAFQRARDAAVALGWEIVDQAPVTGRLEASDRTLIFRFVDDVVIRLRPDRGGGTQLDLRSKSRDGRGDLGANAGRIRAFREAIGD